jgi:hypothetical protein
VDIGGTFTDFVLLENDAGDLRPHKRLTTPDDPARGVLEGIEEMLDEVGVSLGDCETLVHGTTLVTNAVIERRGANTALLTTCGFADILEMGREQRYDIYDLFLEFPEPLVPRRWRIEVDGEPGYRSPPRAGHGRWRFPVGFGTPQLGDEAGAGLLAVLVAPLADLAVEPLAVAASRVSAFQDVGNVGVEDAGTPPVDRSRRGFF